MSNWIVRIVRNKTISVWYLKAFTGMQNRNFVITQQYLEPFNWVDLYQIELLEIELLDHFAECK